MAEEIKNSWAVCSVCGKEFEIVGNRKKCCSKACGEERSRRMKILDQIVADKYTIYNGDSCEVVKGIPDDSIHYTIFSPPFASLYTYSNSDRDMGNCKDDEEFYEHFKFLAKELYRITMPGRLLSFHCMDLPLMKSKDGVIGLKDFPSIIRQVFNDCGFIYHSKVTIWKNPVTEMQRTKALGLLWKQIKKDSSMNRQGIPDYIVTMRKPGDNPERITHTDESFPCDVWQKYASPVWMDIKQSDTLQRTSARDEKDERHISRFRKRQESIMELSEYTVGILRKLRGNRNETKTSSKGK